jgi:Phasin protein
MTRSSKRARSPSRKEPEPTPEVAAPPDTMPEAKPRMTLTKLPEIAEPAPTPFDAKAPVDAGVGEEPIAASATVLDEVERLRGVIVAFWQDHLERTMAAGQSIMACPSPQAAMAVQMSYLQASFASGIAHAGNFARLSTEIARNIRAVRGR